MGIIKKKEIKSPCSSCWKAHEFSFKGCAEKCEKFFTYLKEVVFPNYEVPSPCENLRCGVPGVTIVNGRKIGCKGSCRLTDAYDIRVGKGPVSNWKKTSVNL
jgi:hypothetical protein